MPAEVGAVVLGPYPPPENVKVAPERASGATSWPAPAETVKVVVAPVVPLLLSAVTVIDFVVIVKFAEVKRIVYFGLLALVTVP